MGSLARQILVVDDNGVIARFTAASLIRLGAAARVETAASGEEAWQKVSAEPFDLVISDLHMPGTDGLALLGRIRVHYPGIQLILMTGDVSAEIERRSRRSGVYHCISKPVPAEQLAAIVHDLLAGPGAMGRGAHQQKRASIDPTVVTCSTIPGVEAA